MADIQEVKVVINAEDNASGVFSKFGASIISLNQAAELASKAFDLVKETIGASIQESMKAQTEMAQVAQNVTNAGFSFEKLAPLIKTHGEAMIQLGFDDEAAALSFSRFLQIAKDPDKALTLSALAADVARAKHIDLADATRLVGMVIGGNSRALKEYGIDLGNASSAAERLDALHKQVAGSAAAFADTTAGKLATLSEKWDNVKEKVGNELQPVLEHLLDFALEMIPRVTKFVDDFASAIKTAGEDVNIVTSLFGNLDKAVGQAFGIKNKGLMSSFFDDMKTSVGGVFSFFKTGFDGFTDTLGSEIKWTADKLHVDLVGPMSTAGDAIKESSNKASSAIKAIGTTATDVGNPFAGIGGGAKSAASDAQAAAKAVSDSMTKLVNAVDEANTKILDLQKQRNDLDVQGAQQALATKTNLAQAYVDQVKKIADIQKQLSDAQLAQNTQASYQDQLLQQKKVADIQTSLKKEQDALNSKKTIQIVYGQDIKNLQDEQAKTEFEQMVDKITIQQIQDNEALDAKKLNIQAELDAKQKQVEALKKLEKDLTVAAKAESNDRLKSIGSDIDALITKYNNLAAAAAKAFSVGSLSLPGLNMTPAKHAAGGIISGPYIGAEVAIIGHAGEVVTPVGGDRSGGGAGIVINMSSPMFLDKYAADKFAALLMDRLKMGLRV